MNAANYYIMEAAYLGLMRQIINRGDKRADRTGTGTLSVFGAQLRCDLGAGFPLLTTKRVAFKSIVAELLWFLRGQTDVGILQKQGVKIWDGNSSAEFLAARGLSWRAGDIGPGYGFQWRHFGAQYTGCDSDYTGCGTDQIAALVAGIRADPLSRRHFMSAWNPAQLDEMALPPCHVSAQFYISGGRISCQMYQRSADVFLGLPFNIASYALLTHIIGAVTGYAPGDLVVCIGDAHLYLNHIDAAKKQLERDPRPLPALVVKCADIDAITADDITITGYDPHPAIPAPMAV